MSTTKGMELKSLQKENRKQRFTEIYGVKDKKK